MTKRERDRQKNKDRETNRQKERQTDRQTDRQTERQTDQQRDRLRDKQRAREVVAFPLPILLYLILHQNRPTKFLKLLQDQGRTSNFSLQY